MHQLIVICVFITFVRNCKLIHDIDILLIFLYIQQVLHPRLPLDTCKRPQVTTQCLPLQLSCSKVQLCTLLNQRSVNNQPQQLRLQQELMEDYNNLVVGNKQILKKRIVATEEDLSQMSPLKSDIKLYH